LVLYRLNQIDGDVSNFFSGLERDDYDFLIMTATSVCASVLAAFIVAAHAGQRIEKSMKVLSQLTDPDFIKSFFLDIRRYKNRVRVNERISGSLRPHPRHEGMLQIALMYEFSTVLIDNHLTLSFFRCDGESQMNDYFGSPAHLLRHEFYWAQDEGDFPVVVEADDYKVSAISVNGSNDLPVTRSESDDRKMITYDAIIPDKMLRDGEEANVRLKVVFPIERETVLHITHELPTRSASVNIDYSAVADALDVYSFPITGSESAPKRLEVEEDPHCVIYEHVGWLAPKHGYVICTWEKRIAANA
jgi:hypothetical protein